MGMLNHKNDKKNPLENDKVVKVEQQQTREDILKEKEKKEEPKLQEVTIPRNIRADNHIANKVQAMINIGFADDAKGVLMSLVNDKIASMPEGDQDRINSMVKMLEIKDYFSQQSKNL